MSAGGAARAALVAACGVLGCASLDSAARVSPPVAGAFAGDASALRGATIERSVRHHDNAQLGAYDVAFVGKDGRFDFPPLNLAVTAQEFSKVYLLTLTLVQGGERRSLYREEYSREALRPRLTLSCDLESGEPPCRAAP